MPDSSRAVARDAVAVIGVLAVVGVLCGVLWSVVVTPAEFTKLANGGAMNEPALGAQFGADGWYAVIGGTAGLLAGVAVTWWRSRDALLTVTLLLIGAVLAAVLMALTGHLLGPGDPRKALLAAKIGAKVPESLGLGVAPLTPFGDYLKQTAMFYLSWPVGALAGGLVVLLVRPPASATTPEERTDETPAAEAPAT